MHISGILNTKIAWHKFFSASPVIVCLNFDLIEFAKANNAGTFNALVSDKNLIKH